MNIKKYINGQIRTENGCVYKRGDYHVALSNEIVYIDESSLAELEIMASQGNDLTDDEIINQGLGYSRESIKGMIKETWPDATDEWITEHDIISKIIQLCSWENPGIQIEAMAEWEGDIWRDYPQDKSDKQKAEELLDYMGEMDSDTVINIFQSLLTDAQLAGVYDKLVSEGILRQC